MIVEIIFRRHAGRGLFVTSPEGPKPITITEAVAMVAHGLATRDRRPRRDQLTDPVVARTGPRIGDDV